MRREPGDERFAHGVASGDPLADRVILWTRVTPEAGGDVSLRWQLAEDPGLARVVAAGDVTAPAGRDHTVKVDAGGLAPGTTYYYRFTAGGSASPVGRTRTLPVGSPERLRLALCSCANLASGFFSAYAQIARRADLDVVLHLGDYIYEYANGVFGDGAAIGRVPEPDRELLTLADYRARHAQYKRDRDLQELHRQHPVIAMWDDHELANDAWRGGAQNHQDDEGPWDARREAAIRAYREWLPIREWDEGERYADGTPFRSFRFGDLAELLMLETRLSRDRQLERTDREGLRRRDRTLLGPVQERWLADRLVGSQRDGVAWRLLGQQVVFAPMRDAQGFIQNPDAWDGYPATRGRLFDLWEERGLRDNVILTGDMHSSWALDVPRDPYDRRSYDPSSGRGALAVEFVTPSIATGGAAPREQAGSAAARALRENPHLRWVELTRNGYALLDVDRERAQCEWYHLDSVLRPQRREQLVAAFRARRGGQGLEPAPGPSAPLRGRPAPAR